MEGRFPKRPSEIGCTPAVGKPPLLRAELCRQKTDAPCDCERQRVADSTRWRSRLRSGRRARNFFVAILVVVAPGAIQLSPGLAAHLQTLPVRHKPALVLRSDALPSRWV